MKKWIEKLVAVIALTWLAVFAVTALVDDFTTNAPIHYFAKQPGRLVWVALIGIASGLCAFVFDRLSTLGKRNAKLVAIAIGAGCLTVFTGYVIFTAVSIMKIVVESHPRFPLSEMLETRGFYFFILEFLGPGAVAAFLWFRFYRIWKNKEGDSANL